MRRDQNADRLRAIKHRDQEAGFQAIDTSTCDWPVRRFSRTGLIDTQREQLEAALEYAREGDISVTKLDRLEACRTSLPWWPAEAKAVALKVPEAIDTSNCTGRLMFNMLGAIAQFERELMLERQREGIAKAKAEGKYRGRAPTARAKASEIRRLHGEGIGPTEIAKRLGISRASVYRVLNLSV